MSHDPRCEHSKAKRCRCDCHGTQHGIIANQHQTDLKQLLERIAGELDEYLKVEESREVPVR